MKRLTLMCAIAAVAGDWPAASIVGQTVTLSVSLNGHNREDNHGDPPRWRRRE
jgi:hypothetical protein